MKVRAFFSQHIFTQVSSLTLQLMYSYIKLYHIQSFFFSLTLTVCWETYSFKLAVLQVDYPLVFSFHDWSAADEPSVRKKSWHLPWIPVLKMVMAHILTRSGIRLCHPQGQSCPSCLFVWQTNTYSELGNIDFLLSRLEGETKTAKINQLSGMPSWFISLCKFSFILLSFGIT